MKYIDTHMHVVPSEFDNYEEVIEAAFKNEVATMFVVGCERGTIPETLEIAKKYKGIYPIIGIHPNDATGPSDAKFIRENLTKEVVAIGEIGLDYHWEDNPSKEVQIKVLEEQLDLALEKRLPAIIHSRDAHEDTIKVLSKEKYRDLRIVMHSYAYGAEKLQEYLNIGCYISFSGIVTFKNAHDFKEAAKQVPANRVLSETDAPYLAPVPHRGKKNTPAFVKDTVKYLAELRGESLEELTESIATNVFDIFGIK
ncbi:TatD family hydrolase [Mycoplasma marinum]|uniref:Uncharacterized protein n=1 Tax=Mycoplasma marinum TaxID=1937190 RepID=A0A4R0XLK0_9MOLU|nr:TatD family hydrolase [Mycoplasma marinum]TCG11354.1 hypothetical protein C4B24_02270 [Mycoplasma marinum]